MIKSKEELKREEFIKKLEEDQELIKEEKEKPSDQYDLMEMGSRVHTQSKTLNRDFTLAWTAQTLEKWATKQMLLAQAVEDVLNPKKYINKTKNEAKSIRLGLLSEVSSRIVFTRSRDGRVLKGFLGLNRGEITEEKKKRSILQKLLYGKEEQPKEEE